MMANPVPTASQAAWHELDYYAFVHFGVNAFTNREWGLGNESPSLFAPTALDTDQWCRTFKGAGMRAVILTAKHHDGLCLWPTKFSAHNITQSAVRGDLIAMLRKSCDRYGLKLGLYLSPWDRFHPLYGTPEYNDAYAGQLEEITTNYGELFEVWFDGANGEGPNGKRQVYDWPRFQGIVRKNQPDAVMFSDAGPDIRWVGNESGEASLTNWNTVRSDRFEMATPHTVELGTGHEDGDVWRPAECDVSIRPGWFYHPEEDSKVKNLAQLRSLWLKSVGRGSNLLLNVPPDRTGQIAAPDVAALQQFRKWRDETFRPIATTSPKDGRVNFGRAVTGNLIELREDMSQGQAVRAFRLEANINNQWVKLAEGTTIGNCRLLETQGFTTNELRVIVRAKTGTTAKLKPVKVFMDRLGSK